MWVFCLPPGPREKGRQSPWLLWCLPCQGGARGSCDPFTAPRAGAQPPCTPSLPDIASSPGVPVSTGLCVWKAPLSSPLSHLKAPKVLPGCRPQAAPAEPSPSGLNRRTRARTSAASDPLCLLPRTRPPRAGTASSGPASPSSQSHAWLRSGPGADCHVPDPKNCIQAGDERVQEFKKTDFGVKPVGTEILALPPPSGSLEDP